jgi:hypothetical protein
MRHTHIHTHIICMYISYDIYTFIYDIQIDTEIAKNLGFRV